MEWDKLVEAGEEKKRETRKQLAELRLRFKQLKEQNDRLPSHMRVNSRVPGRMHKTLLPALP